MPTQSLMLDLDWFEHHLLDGILPHWLDATTDEGLFLPHFDRAWHRLDKDIGTLVSQCRLLYNFSQGYALTHENRYLEAVQTGAQFLLKHFRDRSRGGWYWSCNRAGDVLDTHKDAYGHAFAILGLAHAYRCTGDPALQEAVVETWEVFTRHFRDAHGGYIWRMSQEFASTDDTRSQNPVMHLFEALLAAGTVGGAQELLAEARTVGDFVLTSLVRATDRRLPEVYDSDWRELPPAQEGSSVMAGGRLDIGHAFEWAYLTSFAAEQGLPDTYLSYANSFILYGLALGFDWQAGGVYSPASPTGPLLLRRKGWWEQCEAIRALMHFVIRHGRDDLLEPLHKTLDFVQTSLIDPAFGGWYQGIGPDGEPENRAKGDAWKLDYHVVGMCMEAIRLRTLAARP